MSFVACGDSQTAEDDEGSGAGEAGAGTGGAGGSAGRGGRGGSSGSSGRGTAGGEAGTDGEGGGSSGEAGSETSGGSAGKGGAGRDGAGGRGGAGGNAGRGGKGGGNGNGGTTGGTAGDAGAGTAGGGRAGAGGAGAPSDGGTAGSGSSIVTYLWGDYRESLADATSYTFEDVSLATPGPDRLLVVTAHTATNVVANFSSLTIGGTEALKVASVGEGDQPSAPTAFYVLRQPTGTQADIELTLSAGVVRAAIAVQALYGVVGSFPYEYGSNTTMGGATIPIPVPTGGVVLAALGMADSANGTAVWADMFELYDTVMVEGTPTHVSGAMRVASATDTTFNVVVATPSAGYMTRAVAVSFR